MIKVFQLLLVMIILISCSNSPKKILNVDHQYTKKHMVEKTFTDQIREDTIYTDISDIYSTPYIEDPKAYFRENNKYKDWNKKDKRKVLVSFVSEKDGSTSHVQIKKSSDIEKLDNEALRLVKN